MVIHDISVVHNYVTTSIYLNANEKIKRTLVKRSVAASFASDVLFATLYFAFFLKNDFFGGLGFFWEVVEIFLAFREALCLVWVFREF